MTEQQQKLLDAVVSLLRGEWEAGNSGSPGWHHQPAEVTRQQLARILFKN